MELLTPKAMSPILANQYIDVMGDVVFFTSPLTSPSLVSLPKNISFGDVLHRHLYRRKGAPFVYTPKIMLSSENITDTNNIEDSLKYQPHLTAHYRRNNGNIKSIFLSRSAYCDSSSPIPCRPKLRY